jgi:hypothetical protein
VNKLTSDRKAIMSSYGGPNAPFCFFSSIILTKELVKIKSKPVWFPDKGPRVLIIPLSFGGVSKAREVGTATEGIEAKRVVF